jgi:primary-amine oxidase
VFANTGANVSSVTILPLGVTVKFDLTGRNWEDWEAVGWYTGGESYASNKEFRAAINSTDFVKPLPFATVEGDWTSTDRQGPPLPLDDQPPLVSVSQGPQRFKIDAEEGYVSWMDFTFYHSVSHDIGLSLYNIQYKGQRVVYELSLQEALTAYAGDDPFASQATFIDTGTGMGSTLQPLARGYDCPSHATYLPATWMEGNATKTVADAIRLFELDTGYFIRRHSFWPSAPHTSVAKNIQLTLRMIATVVNYDFMLE